MKPNARVLGTFFPSSLHQETMEQEFRALPFLPACCRRERVSIRVPSSTAVHPDNLAWHQDGGGLLGTTQHMILWANQQPTHLKDAAGQPIAFAPGEVIWFDNTQCWHKQPSDTDETTRWFISVRCSGA